MESDPAKAREIAKRFMKTYLGLPNYTNNLRRLGWTEEDITGPHRQAGRRDRRVGLDRRRRRPHQAHLDAGAEPRVRAGAAGGPGCAADGRVAELAERRRGHLTTSDAMDNSEYLAALERDGRAFATSCRASTERVEDRVVPGVGRRRPAVAPRPRCTGSGGGSWRRRRRARTRSASSPVRHRTTSCRRSTTQELDALLAVLRAADPATPSCGRGRRARTSASSSAGWRRRRRCTAGTPTSPPRVAASGRSIEPLLASDGIDEFLEHFVNDPRRGRDASAARCTSTAPTWRGSGSSRRPPTVSSTTREHAKGDARDPWHGERPAARAVAADAAQRRRGDRRCVGRRAARRLHQPRIARPVARRRRPRRRRRRTSEDSTRRRRPGSRR